MYTKEGQMVELVKKIEDGYLGKEIYEDFSEDFEEDGESEFSVGEDIRFFPELFEKPQTQAYAAEVNRLRKEAEEIQADIHELRSLKESESGLLNKISKFPFIQKLVQYVTGDFNFILHLSNYEVSTKNNRYNGPYVKVTNTKEGSWGLFSLYHDNYASNDDKPFLCFNTIEEVNAYVKESILIYINKYDSGFYSSPQNLKDWFGKIHYTQKVKEDPEVLAALETKMIELTSLYKSRRRTEIEKQLQELEGKKKELEKQATI